MIELPVIRELTVDDYGLYPGTSSRPGVQCAFKPGLTLILGANGLGKTTLVTILYRMLTGPYDIPNIAEGSELRNRRVDARPLRRSDRRLFADRVIDDADRATAILTFELGRTTIQVKRALDDLELLNLQVGSRTQATTEAAFQAAVEQHADVSSFGDWILILRHLTFYFEDRRALVWDASAQRQILRLLFLDRETAKEQSRREREILTLDSSVRNLQYAINREEKRATRIDRVLDSADDVRQRLVLLQQAQEDDLERLAEMEDMLVSVEAARQRARVNALTSEQAHETALRSVERLQLTAIRNAFPSASATGRYLIGQIIADQSCLVCRSEVPEYSEELRRRVAHHRCVVCNSAMPGVKTVGRRGAQALTNSLKELDAAETQRNATAAERDAAEAAYDTLATKLAEMTAKTSARSADMDDLMRRLPPDEQAVHEQRSYLSSMRGRLAADRHTLDTLRGEFASFAAGVSGEIASQKDDVKRAFDSYANDFLVEGCELIWAPRRARLGETGGLMEFPAFELDMTGADFHSPVRRTGPQQVSESQREFIDLAFRMALMQVASPGGGTLVIDAPESSLDAVFVNRAATVLTRFGAPESNNRLVITSNLVDGDLIPQLLRRARVKSPSDGRIVDLLKLATPTRATAQLGKEYRDVRRRIFARSKEES